jgi:excisionase family DNA binding protein
MENLYTKKDLSSKLKLSVSTLDNHMKENKLPYIKFGKSVRFTDSDVNEYIQKHNTKKHTANVINSIGVKGLKDAVIY